MITVKNIPSLCMHVRCGTAMSLGYACISYVHTQYTTLSIPCLNTSWSLVGSSLPCVPNILQFSVPALLNLQTWKCVHRSHTVVYSHGGKVFVRPASLSQKEKQFCSFLQTFTHLGSLHCF